MEEIDLKIVFIVLVLVSIIVIVFGIIRFLGAGPLECILHSGCHICGQLWNTNDCTCHKGSKPKYPSECFPCTNDGYSCMCINGRCRGRADTISACSPKSTKESCKAVRGCSWTVSEGQNICTLK